MKYYSVKWFTDDEYIVMANCSTLEKAKKALEIIKDICADADEENFEIFEEDLELDEIWTQGENGNDKCITV